MAEQTRDLERRKALLEKNLITQEDFDLAEGDTSWPRPSAISKNRGR